MWIDPTLEICTKILYYTKYLYISVFMSHYPENLLKLLFGILKKVCLHVCASSHISTHP